MNQDLRYDVTFVTSSEDSCLAFRGKQCIEGTGSRFIFRCPTTFQYSPAQRLATAGLLGVSSSGASTFDHSLLPRS
jgi:hypothetical protein